MSTADARRWVASLALATLAGCAAPPPPAAPDLLSPAPPPPAERVVVLEAPPAPGLDDVVVEIGDDKITARQVLDLIRQRERKVFDEAVEDLMVRWVVRRENDRLRVSVPEAAVATDVEGNLAEGEKYARLQYQMSFVELLNAQGRTLDEVRALARETSVHRHTLARLVRHSQLQRGLLRLRRIRLASRDRAEAVRRQLAEGADFDELLRQESALNPLRANAATSTVVPGQFAAAGNAGVEEAVWSLSPGEVSPVLEVPLRSDSQKLAFFVFQVISREPAAAEASFADLATRVEATLSEFPVGDVEIEWWLNLVRPSYPVRPRF